MLTDKDLIKKILETKKPDGEAIYETTKTADFMAIIAKKMGKEPEDV